jgi:Rrf2 family protein
MKFIKRDTDYAFQALVFLAKNEMPYTVEYVSKELGLPNTHLRKIFQTLSSNGILSSTKGRNGGFKLNGDSSTISMARIIKIFQGDIDLTNCVVNKKGCNKTKDCFIREKLKNISSILEQELNKITLK